MLIVSCEGAEAAEAAEVDPDAFEASTVFAVETGYREIDKPDLDADVGLSLATVLLTEGWIPEPLLLKFPGGGDTTELIPVLAVEVGLPVGGGTFVLLFDMKLDERLPPAGRLAELLPRTEFVDPLLVARSPVALICTAELGIILPPVAVDIVRAPVPEAETSPLSDTIEAVQAPVPSVSPMVGDTVLPLPLVPLNTVAASLPLAPALTGVALPPFVLVTDVLLIPALLLTEFGLRGAVPVDGHPVGPGAP